MSVSNYFFFLWWWRLWLMTSAVGDIQFDNASWSGPMFEVTCVEFS